ncbi:MAG: hypothetical protein HGA45_30765 [Chloroflexales bacterium]|nr:hypothetical protein [Chloroflexales bacterium]
MEREEDLAAKLRALIAVWGVEGARAMFSYQATTLPPDARARVAALAFGDHSQMGDVSIGNVAGGDMTTGTLEVGHDARIDGVAVAVNLGQIIYGRDPGEDERRQLVWYLSRLAAKLRRLPLRGLDPKLDERGRGLDLGKVYTELVVRDVSASFAEGPIEQILSDYFDGDGSTKVLKAAYHPDNALPSRAAFDIVGVPAGTDEPDNTTNRGLTEPMLDEVFRIYTHPRVYLTRPMLVVERVRRYRCYVLTGSPGSGKSTFLRYLGWELAQRALGQESSLRPDTPWGPPRDSLPILLSLRTLAGRLARDGVSDQTIFAALRDELSGFNIGPAEQLLSEALHRGGARLLLDGLDEVPLEGAPGVTTDRLRTLQAVHQFARTHEQVSVIVTCRTRAFDERFRDLVGWRHWEARARHDDTDWEVDELAPFTLGQIRHFVPAWYRELVATGQLDASQAAGLERALLDTTLGRPRLQALAATPLLLTMMTLVLYHDGALPRDRSLLYERILELLLGQWDKVRDGQSLSEAIGQPDWDSDRIRPLLVL